MQLNLFNNSIFSNCLAKNAAYFSVSFISLNAVDQVVKRIFGEYRSIYHEYLMKTVLDLGVTSAILYLANNSLQGMTNEMLLITTMVLAADIARKIFMEFLGSRKSTSQSQSKINSNKMDQNFLFQVNEYFAKCKKLNIEPNFENQPEALEFLYGIGEPMVRALGGVDSALNIPNVTSEWDGNLRSLLGVKSLAPIMRVYDPSKRPILLFCTLQYSSEKDTYSIYLEALLREGKSWRQLGENRKQLTRLTVVDHSPEANKVIERITRLINCESIGELKYLDNEEKVDPNSTHLFLFDPRKSNVDNGKILDKKFKALPGVKCKYMWKGFSIK